jgi:hypothetical protein
LPKKESELSEWQTAIEALMLRSRGVLDHRADHPRLELMMQQVPVLVPVAAAPLKAAEFLTFFGRKTGNECPALTTIVDEVRHEPDCETGGKTDEETCPKHTVLRSAS